jgi:hypothetical protein
LIKNLTLPGFDDAYWSGDTDYYIGMIVDTDNHVSNESNETNNSNLGTGIDRDLVAISGTTAPTPDLYSVSGIPTSPINVGESFTVTVTAENDGPGTGFDGSGITASVRYDDNSDSVSNLTVTGPLDVSWADVVYFARPGIETINGYDPPGQFIADDYFVEAVDHNWTVGEQHSMSFTVTPNKAGTLYIRLRTTMSDSQGQWHNMVDSTNAIDQQGWGVVQIETQVEPANLDIATFNIDSTLLEWGGELQCDVDIVNSGGDEGTAWVKLIASNDEILWDSDDKSIFDVEVTLSPGGHWTLTDEVYDLPSSPWAEYTDDDTVYFYLHIGTPYDDQSGPQSRDISLPMVDLSVPYYNQNDSGWCWATSLSMLLEYYGYDQKPWEIAADLDKPFEGLLSGAGASQSKDYLEAYFDFTHGSRMNGTTPMKVSAILLFSL